VNLGPLTPFARVKRLKDDVDDLLYAEIERRRAQQRRGVDILSLLIEARHEDGEPMTGGELHDEMITMLAAGHETTATALAWAFYHLLANPSALARVERELEQAGETVGGPSVPEGRFEYLDAVIKESLRLKPIIPSVSRTLKTPARIGGCELPAGVTLVPCIYLAHRRPAVWPDPHTFRPERFLGTRPSPYEFLPFGGGTRRCLGMAFALYEMRIVLAEVLSRVVLHASRVDEVRVVRRSITLAPSDGMPVTIERRAA
jgi:cytochrome P450